MYLKVDVIIQSYCVLRIRSESIWLVVNIVYIGQVNLDIVALGTQV